MYGRYQQYVCDQLNEIKAANLYKNERVIDCAQDTWIHLANGRKLLNLCANNYLGLSQSDALRDAAQRGLEDWGYGMASVRFICGTQSIHKELELRISEFLQTADTILYPSCFDANGGLYESLLTSEDAVISDALNHASIIDGVRLCKAKRYRYRNNDMADLETQLQAADDAGARFKLISTDGVFSMDGSIARLDRICDLADQYDALVHFDDSHATGFLGSQGKGTHEYCDCMDRIDITTSTLGKALGGASGGYTSGRGKIIELLRQRSRPYLFSNTIAPPVVAGAIKALDLLSTSTQLRDKLMDNTSYFRQELESSGFDILPGEHPIIAIMFYDALAAKEFAEQLLTLGIYVIAFSYPVVPKGQARIRVQISAAHSREDLDFALESFRKVNCPK